jgi:hypothetical protein
MSESKSYAEVVIVWEEILAAVERNIGDLPQLEIPRQRLQSMLTQIKAFAAEQATFTASRQEATNRVYFLLAQGRKLVTVLRTAVREHYGNRSEKLAEFGLQPLRTRSRRPTDENPLPQPE